MPPDDIYQDFEELMNEIRDLLDDRMPGPNEPVAFGGNGYWISGTSQIQILPDISQGPLYNSQTWKVHSIDIQLTESKEKRKMLKITYYSDQKVGNNQKIVSNQYLCFDKPGYGKSLAKDWWIKAIGNIVPETSEEAYKILQKIEPIVLEVSTIPSKTNRKFRNVVNVKFGPARDRPKKPLSPEEANAYLSDMFDEILE